MARIRSIKPGFCTSLDIAPLSVPCRLHFVMLWTYADDEGRGIDDPRLIKAALWPLDDDIGCDEIDQLQAELEVNGRLVRYDGTDGRSYFQITGFQEHQKPQKPAPSKLPAPTTVPLCDSYSSPTVAVSSVGESSSRGEVEVGESSNAHLAMSEPPPPSADFEAFWRAYPRRVGKKDANKAWTAALKRAPAGQILAGLERVIPSWRDPQFTPHPATWLNRDGWLDEPDPPKLNPSLAAVVRVAQSQEGR